MQVKKRETRPQHRAINKGEKEGTGKGKEGRKGG